MNEGYIEDAAKPKKGLKLRPDDISTLVDRVTLAPGASKEVEDTVNIVIERYAPSISVEKSTLDKGLELLAGDT